MVEVEEDVEDRRGDEEEEVEEEEVEEGTEEVVDVKLIELASTEFSIEFNPSLFGNFSTQKGET